MLHILLAVSSSLDYASIDIETVVVLFLIISLVVGLLVNFPSISFLSKKESDSTINWHQRRSKNIMNTASTNSPDDKDNDEVHAKNRRSTHKKSVNDFHTLNQRKHNQNHHESKPKQSKVIRKVDIKYTIRCIFIFMSPILIISALPAFYPIYKSYIGPFLPDIIQHFFTDIKNLFLAFFNLCVTGAILDGSYQSNSLSEVLGNPTLSNNSLFSMQDWIYSYIRHCDLSQQYQLHSFCLTCSSPTIFEKWMEFHTIDMSIPCDQCVTETHSSDMGVSLFEHANCIDLVNDISRIVNAKNNYLNKSFAMVIVDCVNTFVLYIRFFIHLSSRMFVRFIYNCIHTIRQVFNYYLWVWREIIQTYPINPSRSFALLFILIVLIFLSVWSIRVIIRFLCFILHLFFPSLYLKKEKDSSFIAPDKKPPPLSAESIEFNFVDEHSLLSDRIHAARRRASGVDFKPSWITPEVEASYRGNGNSLHDQWLFIVKNNPAIAELIVDCTATNDECDLLMKLLEQLHTEKEISFSLIDSIRAIMSTRPVAATPPSTTFNKHPVRSVPSATLPFTPMQELQSPAVFSPPTENKRLGRAGTGGFSWVARPPFFRMQKGKSLVSRNSVSESVSRFEREELL